MDALDIPAFTLPYDDLATRPVFCLLKKDNSLLNRQIRFFHMYQWCLGVSSSAGNASKGISLILISEFLMKVRTSALSKFKDLLISFLITPTSPTSLISDLGLLPG
ncbi:uncharacterized protein LOC143898851 [Temnothorax americanus]|uniref:uncharacterized protein LOC143898851 n=1 Tax=Temnothorax americanus TaxID=1964332 RepID=UPI0040679ABC